MSSSGIAPPRGLPPDITGSPPRIGDVLLRRGAVSPADIDAALLRQRREGGLLGEHLLLMGAVSRRALFDALGEQWAMPVVDLLDTPPDPALARQVPFEDLLAGGWIALDRTPEGTLRVATTYRPDAAQAAAIARWFAGMPVEHLLTTPWDLRHAASAAHRTQLLHLAQDSLATSKPDRSALPGLTWWQAALPFVALAVLIVAAVIDLRRTFVGLLVAANAAFSFSMVFKAMAALREPHARAVSDGRRLAEMRERLARGLPPVWRPPARDEADLPFYTVLVPVYREANIVHKLLDNLGALDWPKSRLEVLVLLEEDDVETIAAAKAAAPPEYVRLLVVPEGFPKTKPRACNYGLAFARGQYVVIYDAEDRPEPDQLRRSVAAFERDRFEREILGVDQPPLAVAQASLSYFNADYNILTRMFAVEYAHWFDAMLPGLEGTGIPLPLGGTSNHFDTEVLRRLGAWDPYNVTEDADLGLRVSVEGYRVTVIDSSTGEEACAATPAWIRQRTRWIKGYLITSAVNLRHPVRFARRVGFAGMVGMLGLILGTPLAFLLYPVVTLFTIVTFVGTRTFGLELPVWLVGMSIAGMVFGNVLVIATAVVAGTRRYSWRIGVFGLLNPLYWTLHAIAAWRALVQTVVSPHHWEKTPHGISEDYESDAH
ncbi:MAG: glycosyltransferase [Austwickia sp.]|nr:glycosyltransferase [Actinomycetota bacterium]MCB1254134.1 glycosyltransferase [Austwickia sp.]MCO5308637.1 glycosyltransferase [Austwickia sp.]